MIFDFSKIPKWSRIHYVEFEMEIALDAFKTLQVSQEKILTEKEQELNNLIANDEYLKNCDPHENYDYYFHYYESDHRVLEDLRRMQRYGLCLTIYSFCEGKLRSLSNDIDQEFKFKIQVDDLGGMDDLMKFWVYFEKVFEIDVAMLQPSFTPLKQQKIVRNIIAHQDGFLKPEQQKKIEIKNGLRIHESLGEFRIDIYDTEYITYLLDRVDQFFKQLYLAADKRYTQLKT